MTLEVSPLRKAEYLRHATVAKLISDTWSLQTSNASRLLPARRERSSLAGSGRADQHTQYAHGHQRLYRGHWLAPRAFYATGIFFGSGFNSTGLLTRTSRTPSVIVAWIWSAWTSNGSGSRR